MFDFGEGFDEYLEYAEQRDSFIRNIVSSFASFSFLGLIRAQIPEVDVLQLVPGYYFLLVFLSFLFLIIFGEKIFRPVLETDEELGTGVKNTDRGKLILEQRITFYLLFTLVLFITHTILPISLDSFNSYGTNNVENYWSLDRILELEILLLALLSTFSQTPISLMATQNEQEYTGTLPRSWKLFIFFSLLAAGILTPTVDGSTQISFAISGLVLYFYSLNSLRKQSIGLDKTFLPTSF